MFRKNKVIYLAGGCFWGLEGYFKKIKYIKDTTCGYANSKIENPTYENVCSGISDSAETVKIIYDSSYISLTEILMRFFVVIDPFSINKQGNDVGRQYRTGIYYTDDNDKIEIEKFINFMNEKLKRNVAVECQKLENFYEAETYHQDYLDKNPFGYCHINLFEADKMLIDPNNFKNLSKDSLSDMQFAVTQENATEPPFENEFDQFFEKGLYVDIVSKEPLFLSVDKFNCSCGWPGFSKPVFHDSVKYIEDLSFGMKRIEVRSAIANSHLGHVFPDGPMNLTGLRYCINSSSLEFIPFEKLKKSVYENLLVFF